MLREACYVQDRGEHTDVLRAATQEACSPPGAGVVGGMSPLNRTAGGPTPAVAGPATPALAQVSGYWELLHGCEFHPFPQVGGCQ